MEKDRYDILKSAYEFLNTQINEFERTVEMQFAEYHLLKELGHYTGSTKVQLTRFVEGEYSLVNEWRINSEAQGTAPEGMVFMSDPNWTAAFQSRESIHIEDVERIPEKLKAAYGEMKKEKIQSMYVFPVFDGDHLIAIVNLCNPDENKLQGIIEIHEVLANWLGYRLIKNDNRVQKTLSGLGADYTAAYIINVDTDCFEVIINQKSNNVAKQKKQLYFTDYLHAYANRYVLEKDREAMKHELCVETIRKKFETGKEFHFMFETEPNEIGQTCFQAHAVREYGPDGRYAVVGFRCVDELIQKERKYQRELDAAYKMAQQQLDIITCAIPGGVKISNDDPVYSFKYVSEQYAEMLGYTVEEFMEASGGTIAGIVHPDDLETGIAAALKQYETSDHYAITYRMRCKDGSWKYIEDHGHKVINADGTVEHWNLILDKNELVEKTIALESEKKANAAKTAFLSRMSHDIRTPLNGIIGLLEINEKHADDLEMLTRNRKKARVAADHLLSLINDILELNKLGDEKVVLSQEAFDMKALAREIRTITEMRAAEEGITLHADSREELKYPYVIGSPLHVKQIFINIITNAIKYNKPGGAVDCLLEEKMLPENKVQYDVRIRDTGIGMSESFLKTIFEPFTQEAQDARSVYQGTGLGMPIVKNLIDRMGGTIRIESREGIGTTVFVTLTFPIAEKADIHRAGFQPKKGKTDLAGIHVLLAEDNELNREIARVILEDEHMVVTEACDGKQAFDLYQNSPEYTFDLILMDVMMPVMGGYEATRKIRRSWKADASSVPIFAMTANAFVEDRQAAKEAGMNEHIAKPIDADLLKKKIAEYCR